MKLGIHFDLSNLDRQSKELDYKMQESNFWNNIENAQRIAQEYKTIKDKINRFNDLELKLEVTNCYK